jgi:hypothetical protein
LDRRAVINELILAAGQFATTLYAEIWALSSGLLAEGSESVEEYPKATLGE